MLLLLACMVIFWLITFFCCHKQKHQQQIQRFRAPRILQSKISAEGSSVDFGLAGNNALDFSCEPEAIRYLVPKNSVNFETETPNYQSICIPCCVEDEV